MPEYIEREALVDNLNHFVPEYYNALINDLICKQPAVDAIRVVRCKDCTHLYGTICAVCGLLPRNPNDFCSYGERKDGGDSDAAD